MSPTIWDWCFYSEWNVWNSWISTLRDLRRFFSVKIFCFRSSISLVFCSSSFWLSCKSCYYSFLTDYCDSLINKLISALLSIAWLIYIFCWLITSSFWFPISCDSKYWALKSSTFFINSTMLSLYKAFLYLGRSLIMN